MEDEDLDASGNAGRLRIRPSETSDDSIAGTSAGLRKDWQGRRRDRQNLALYGAKEFAGSERGLDGGRQGGGRRNCPCGTETIVIE